MKWIIAVAATTLLTGVGANNAVDHNRSSPVQDPVAALVLSTPFSKSPPCTVNCNDGPLTCQEGFHYAWTSEIPHHLGTPHEGNYCAEDSCEEKHSLECGPADDDAPAVQEPLRIAVAAGDVAIIRGLLQRTPKNVEFNAARRAMQVLDCKGHVVVHLPLRPRVAEQLMAAMD